MNHVFDIDNRTAGAFNSAQGVRSVQAWKTQRQDPTPQQQIEQNFEAILNETSQTPAVNSFVELETNNINLQPETRSFNAYDEARTVVPKHKPVATKDSYKFGDVIDIINPLHHLPIVGMIYRGVTGDEIKPASQIIGGGIFGGPIGAVSGTVNAIAQIKTGKDIADNVMTMTSFTGTANNTDKTLHVPEHIKDNPEARLDYIASGLSDDNKDAELPGTALAFANLAEINRGYIKTNMADGRTAGSQVVRKQNVSFQAYQQPRNWAEPQIESINLDTDMPAHEKMTTLSLSAMPLRQFDN